MRPSCPSNRKSVRHHYGSLRCLLCVLISCVAARADESETESGLSPYKAVAGVIGSLGCHKSAGSRKLMQIWNAEFKRIYPGVKFELDDDSYEDVAGGAATFGPRLGQGGAPAVRRFRQRFGHAPVEIPVCFYVIEVLVHKDSAFEGGLSMKGLERIFDLDGPDVSWGHLGIAGDCGKSRIALYAPRERAEYLLWTRLGSLFLFKPSVLRRADSADVVASVSGDICGLGLAESGSKTAGVRALPLSRAGDPGFVSATPASVRSGSYPLAEALYLTLNYDPDSGFEIDPVRREFLRFILSAEGQQAVVKAGHVALSAEQAERSLAMIGLTPTGQGTWERMMSGLRERQLTRTQRRRIELRVAGIGDQPTDEQLGDLANLLARTELASSVTFTTEDSGATVRFRFLGQKKAVPVNDWTNRVEATVSIGLYCAWTERNGKPTSPTDAWFPVIREHERIKIYETIGREAEMSAPMAESPLEPR